MGGPFFSFHDKLEKDMASIEVASLDMTVPEGGAWINEGDIQRRRQTVKCAQEVRKYLRSNLEQELGCLIKRLPMRQFEVIPFVNGDPTAVTIKMLSVEDFEVMRGLYTEGTLWGWFHSHPWGRPYPSMTDLSMHNLNINMGIYGGASDTMSIFDTYDLDEMLAQVMLFKNKKGVKKHG
jgi:proteasome lid subunit RPN8/RPN11